MPANKDRLYVALYARAGSAKMPGLEDTYHWAIIIGPKKESKDNLGTKFHAKSAVGHSKWIFEEKQIQLCAVDMILTRVLIAKVTDLEKVKAHLRGVPLKQYDNAFNCVAWVKDAMEVLAGDKEALGTACLDWKEVRDVAMTYCQRKRDEHRFDGSASFNASEVPTLDLLGNREMVA